MAEDLPDPEQLKQILSVVSTEIPKLVEAITKTMYNTENAQSMAKAVAEFYKSMKGAGMNEKQAYELTQEFMSSFSIGGMISKAIQGGASRGDDIDEFVDEKIKQRIKEKLEEKSKGDD
jgi:phosphopantetheine adenylyltransferase